MEARRASYADTSSGDSDSDSDSDSKPIPNSKKKKTQSPPLPSLPPPPISLLNPLNSIGTFDYLQSSSSQPSRVRTFPHVEGNNALHVTSQDPRPHISIAWELGDTSALLKRVLEEEMKKYIDGGSSKRHMFTCKFGGIDCKVGNKMYNICKFQEEQ